MTYLLMRYNKQITVKKFGQQTQDILAQSTIAIIGCGALGSLQSELLTRMGVGKLRIADGDRVTIGNIHRQLLFSEKDARENRLKVDAAKTELQKINSEVEITELAEFITESNISAFIDGASIVLDATDDIAIRFLINDSCLKAGIPWIYTGVAGTQGLIMPVLPHGPCLRCLYPEPPNQEGVANCNNSGILPTTVTMAVSIQINQVLKILTGEAEAGTLIKFDCWDPKVQSLKVQAVPGCICAD